jgi:hypothetical protein
MLPPDCADRRTALSLRRFGIRLEKSTTDIAVGKCELCHTTIVRCASLHPQVAAASSPGRRLPGGSGERLFTLTRLPPSQWRSARTTNAIERLHEEFKRRIKTQTMLPSADTAAMLFWALLASGQINMRKVDGWQTLATNPIDQQIDLAA